MVRSMIDAQSLAVIHTTESIRYIRRCCSCSSYTGCLLMHRLTSADVWMKANIVTIRQRQEGICNRNTRSPVKREMVYG